MKHSMSPLFAVALLAMTLPAAQASTEISPAPAPATILGKLPPPPVAPALGKLPPPPVAPALALAEHPPLKLNATA